MRIKIHKDIWEIKLTDRNKKKMNPGRGRYNLGLTEYDKLRINIRKGLPESVTRSTVIHELTHVFQFSYSNQVEGEEQMCDFFGAHGDEIISLTDQFMKEVFDHADNGRN